MNIEEFLKGSKKKCRKAKKIFEGKQNYLKESKKKYLKESNKKYLKESQKIFE